MLGVAYKPDIDDLRESPALDVIGLLEQKGALVSYHDPYVPRIQHDGRAHESIADLMPAIKTADCVIIVTNHSSYDYEGIFNASSLIVDTRNALKTIGRGSPKVFKL